MSRRTVLLLMVSAALGLTATSGSAASLTLTSKAFTSYRTCTISATPATTTSVIDATVRQATPTTNVGTATTLDVSSATNANTRLHVKFDLTKCSPVIPTTATLRLATIRLFLTAVPAVCRTLDVFASTAAWTETGVTWNTQPAGTAINNPANTGRTIAFTVGSPVGCTNRVAATYAVGATVTADVARFVSGAGTNFGWMIRDDVEGSATTATSSFSSKEAALPAQAPQLVVTYVTTP